MEPLVNKWGLKLAKLSRRSLLSVSLSCRSASQFSDSSLGMVPGPSLSLFSTDDESIIMPKTCLHFCTQTAVWNYGRPAHVLAVFEASRSPLSLHVVSILRAMQVTKIDCLHVATYGSSKSQNVKLFPRCMQTLDHRTASVY